MTNEPDNLPLSEADEARLVRQLDSLGREVRGSEGLADRVFSASLEHLGQAEGAIPFPAHASKVQVWSRIALAACLLLAFAATIRLAFSPGGNEGTGGAGIDQMVASSEDPAVVGLQIDFEPETDRETVLFAILDAGASGNLQVVDGLDGSDTYGIAFAPILGTAGFELNDFAEEIQSIEGSMRR